LNFVAWTRQSLSNDGMGKFISTALPEIAWDLTDRDIVSSCVVHGLSASGSESVSEQKGLRWLAHKAALCHAHGMRDGLVAPTVFEGGGFSSQGSTKLRLSIRRG
jgi:hypothetical protein